MDVLKEYQLNFEAGDYNKALFILINNKDKFDPSVHEYNLGILWARKENLVESRLHFEKAKKLGLINKELVKNLDMVKDQLGVSYIEQSNSFESDMLKLTLDTSIYSPIIISSIILITLLLFIKNFVNAISLGLTIAIASLPIFGYLYVHENYQTTLIREEIAVREGPSKIFEETQTLPSGMKIITKKNNGEQWYYVVVPKSHTGWISEPKMEVL